MSAVAEKKRAPIEIEPVDLPHYTYASEVHFDELDAWQMLHNSRYGIHVDRANAAWYADLTGKPFGPAEDPDQLVFMRELHLEFKAPLMGPQTMWIDLWRTRFGRSSATHVFSCRNEDGSVEYVRGRRTIVKIDPATASAVPWSDELWEAAERDDARREKAIADARRD